MIQRPAFVALSILVFSAPAVAGQPLASRVVGVAITVSDLDGSVAFFRDVLGFEEESAGEHWGTEWERLEGVFPLRLRRATMRLGSERIDLVDYLAPASRPVPEELGGNDLFFQHVAIVVSDMEAAYLHLRGHGVEHISSAPQRLPDWNPSAGGIQAFYFRDPDGHALELITFPPDKGDPRWQVTGGPLFLGIDHTAIAVSDTAVSLGFYRDLLGLRIAGQSENWGSEQEHLNGVFASRVRITGLRAAGGPGIEFLEYLSPGDGRPTPEDLRASDLAHWQTVLEVSDLQRAWERLRETGVSFVSPGPIEFPRPEAGFSRALQLRDPDGHALLLVER
jgi:catechol 2,3-dioxygenase-like lactoylglutathione lyase family enzyme